MAEMQAIWLEDQDLSLRIVPIPTPSAGEALVRVRLAGICATDLELTRGYYPYAGILGHEFVGEVEFAPEQPGLVGARVVGEINAVCHRCATCLRGDETHCENRTVLGIVNRDGAFASYLCLPYENLRIVPSAMPDEVAVFTEPTAAALEILEQVSVLPGDRVLLVGAGRLGQLIAQVLSETGCDLLVAARHTRQRDLLAARQIQWIDPAEIPPAGFDIVIEATGAPAGFESAQKAVRPRGTIVLKSTYAGSLEADFSSIVVREITLIGSRCGPFDEALAWLSNGRVDPLPLVEGRFGLHNGLDAFAEAARPGVLKIFLEP